MSVGALRDRAQHLVLFGASGDLASRMLLPALYFLELEGLLHPSLKLTGVSRTDETSDAFLNRLWASVANNRRTEAAGSKEAAEAWKRFAGRISYAPLDATDPAALADLVSLIGPEADIVAYMATSPSLYGPISRALRAAGAIRPGSRVVLEKPIGRDLATAKALNDEVAEVFSEENVLRIDHYLGKETVQNLVALRFANTLFEPLWNNLSIDHVQITIAETQGVGDRWPYYDDYGALRDMLQNHLLQLLCLVAMEPPSDLDPESVRNEKLKVLRSLRPIGHAEVGEHTVRGQYQEGMVENEVATSYSQERGSASDTETYVAIRAHIDNWRWAGVPFFLRTGKRLSQKRTEIVIQFKAVPHSIFSAAARRDLTPNQLVITLQPEEDISLVLMNKAAGLGPDGMSIGQVSLSLSNGGQEARTDRRIAYERLLLDALDGNSTLFVGRSEVERAWEWVDGIATGWAENRLPVRPYAAGTWGPAAAHTLTESSGRHWRE